MIASRGLTILGSGTVSTRTSCLPCQVSARIVRNSDLIAMKGKLLSVRAGRRVRRLRGCDLPGFHQLLEATKILSRLDLGLLLKQLRN